MRRIDIPSAYRAGYEKAAPLDPVLAGTYVEHTIVDDPGVDAVIDALDGFEHPDKVRFLNAGMERDAKVLAEAPRPLRDFFEEIEIPPAWFDREAILPGGQPLHEHLDLFIVALISVTLRNFNSLMSKVFLMTGRYTTEQGLRQLRANTRFLLEMMMLPDALERQGRGWKFSVRIRLIHAHIRRQLRNSDQWDEAALGAPCSAANMALASANFSASLIQDLERLGVPLDADSRSRIMQIWRYASWLIGTPEAMLFDGDETRTAEFARIAHLCEPDTGHAPVLTSNVVVRGLPALARETDPDAKQAMVEHAYRVFRALLGDKLADRLRFPRHRTAGLLKRLRYKRRIHRACGRVTPRMARNWGADPFAPLLDAVTTGDLGRRLSGRLEA